MQRVPVYAPVLGPEAAERVALAVEHGELSGTMPTVRHFERAWAELCGMPHGVAVSSGTAALELALAALGIGPGDEVVCPASTIIACARAIVLCGAVPVLVDVEPDTYCLDVERVSERIGPRTRAILAVHAFGHPYDHEPLEALARRHRLLVVEDAAQAHGASLRVAGTRRRCGSFGDVSAFSFYANKAITTGEGGMVLCRDGEVASRIRNLANLCFGTEQRYLHRELGHNYRLSSLQAALGLAQVERLEEILASKRRVAALYRERLSGLEELVLQAVRPGTEPIFWMIAGVLADAAPLDARQLGEALLRRGIETRPFFLGLHEQPALHARGLFEGERYPVSERIAARGIILPSGPGLDEAIVERVVGAVREALAEARRQERAFVPQPDATPDVPAEHGAPFRELYAEAYDALYADKDYAAEVTLLERCFTRFSLRPVRRVLDVGCGTGRHAAELAARGYEVVGVDASAEMLALARRREPNVRFLQADVRSLPLTETFDAALLMFAVLSYQATASDVLAALSEVRRILPAGAPLLGDIWYGSSPGARVETTRRSARQGDVEWLRVGRLSRFPLEQRVEARYELRQKHADQVRVARELHVLRWFHAGELQLALSATGFELCALTSVDDLERPPRPSDGAAFFVARAVDVGRGVVR
jgi:perosamine synthetase